MGRDNLDLDLGNLLDECTNAGCWYVLADAERGAVYFQPILPYFLCQLWIVSIEVPLVLIKTNFAIRKAFFFFMTTNILLAFYVWFLIPETKSIPLEEIDVIFGGANHTEKGGDLLHVEDAHRAHLGVDNVDGDQIVPANDGHNLQEIKI
jgi:hypothetical protein